VGGERRPFVEGEVLAFDDSFEHEVLHRGRGLRVVLVADIWHPQVPPAMRTAVCRKLRGGPCAVEL
jgi:aspartate beta-hydroxylase